MDISIKPRYLRILEIKKSNYWINPVNEKSEQAFKDRVESIITRSDLPNPNIF